MGTFRKQQTSVALLREAAAVLCWSLLLTAYTPLFAQDLPTDSGYILGADDQLAIWALGAEELSTAPVRIDLNGDADLPLAGRLHAAGLTVGQFKTALSKKLEAHLRTPQVTVTVTEYRSQPISVLGAVNKPGVYHLRGPRTLIEVLSMAEGLRTDAGSSVRLTRRRAEGDLPLPGAVIDPVHQVSAAELNIKAVMEAREPASSLAVRPYDVITVSRGQTVYVIGEVRKSGGFLLGDRDSVSVLQALSFAEGLTRQAAAHKAKILRAPEKGANRSEIAVDVRKMLAGKTPDVPLQQDDILFIPDNKSRNAAWRALETAVSVGSGVVIWRVGVPR